MIFPRLSVSRYRSKTSLSSPPNQGSLRIDMPRATIDPYHFRPTTTVGYLLVIFYFVLPRDHEGFESHVSIARTRARFDRHDARRTMRGTLTGTRRRGSRQGENRCGDARRRLSCTPSSPATTNTTTKTTTETTTRRRRRSW